MSATAIPTPFAQVEAITFDVGGTLLYPYPSVGEIYAEVMGKHGIDRDGRALDAAFRRAWDATARAPGRAVDAAAERAWWRALVGRVLHDLDYHGDVDPMFNELWVTFSDPHHWRLFDGALTTLTTLRARGYRLAVLSNWDERLRPLLHGLELTPHFEHCAISSELGIEKPDARIFRHVEDTLGLGPDKLLHVGDSDYHDVGGAHAAGWPCIRLLQHQAAVPPTSVAALTALLDWLPPRASR